MIEWENLSARAQETMLSRASWISWPIFLAVSMKIGLLAQPKNLTEPFFGSPRHTS